MKSLITYEPITRSIYSSQRVSNKFIQILMKNKDFPKVEYSDLLIDEMHNFALSDENAELVASWLSKGYVHKNTGPSENI
jgi:hypothetical protein